MRTKYRTWQAGRQKDDDDDISSVTYSPHHPHPVLSSSHFVDSVPTHTPPLKVPPKYNLLTKARTLSRPPLPVRLSLNQSLSHTACLSSGKLVVHSQWAPLWIFAGRYCDWLSVERRYSRRVDWTVVRTDFRNNSDSLQQWWLRHAPCSSAVNK